MTDTTTNTTVFAVGVDVETTGLDIANLDLLEVSMATFNSNLEALDLISVTIHHDLNDLNLNGVVAMMHTENGLLKDVEDATYTLDEAETTLCAWLDEHMEGYDAKPYMLGSSITFDRQVLETHMPELYSRFHYRSLDATTVSLLAKEHGVTINAAAQPSDHRSYSDVLRSAAIIAEGYITPLKGLSNNTIQTHTPEANNHNSTTTEDHNPAFATPQKKSYFTESDYNAAPITTVITDSTKTHLYYKANDNLWVEASALDGDRIEFYTPYNTVTNAELDGTRYFHVLWTPRAAKTAKDKLLDAYDYITAPAGTIIKAPGFRHFRKQKDLWTPIEYTSDHAYVVKSEADKLSFVDFYDATSTVTRWHEPAFPPARPVVYNLSDLGSLVPDSIVEDGYGQLWMKLTDNSWVNIKNFDSEENIVTTWGANIYRDSDFINAKLNVVSYGFDKITTREA